MEVEKNSTMFPSIISANNFHYNLSVSFELEDRLHGDLLVVRKITVKTIWDIFLIMIMKKKIISQ